MDSNHRHSDYEPLALPLSYAAPEMWTGLRPGGLPSHLGIKVTTRLRGSDTWYFAIEESGSGGRSPTGP